jgi:hypothetical protein
MMQTYSHSGAAPVGGAIKTVLIGVLTATVGGIIYAYAFYWIPFVYLNFLITLAYAGAMGLAIAITARRARIRNNWFVAIVGFVVALVGLYVYWAAYLWALAGIQNVGLAAFSPSVLIAFGKHLFEKGSWGIKKETVTGWFLVAFWIAEALLILRVCVSFALAEARRPFCESCGEWTEIEENVARLASTGDEPEWQQVFAGDLPSLAAFPAAEQGANRFARLDVARCPRCEQSRFLTVSTVKVTIDKKGKANEDVRRLITNAILTPAQFAVVEACSKLYRQNELARASGGGSEEGNANAASASIKPVEPAPGEP